ncbi:hypothetical protein ABTN16_19340, partial [Acinetobacter baumannii]
KFLKKGDWIYAQYIARFFLEGDQKVNKADSANKLINVSNTDCCDAAAAFVLSPYHGTKVATIYCLKNFDDEYKSINKVLPVYKVSFER